MFTFKELHDIHVEIGLWDTPEKKSRYGYVLSPEVFVLDKKLRQQLGEIGFLVKDYLNGVSSLSQNILIAKSGDHSMSLISRMLGNGLNGLPFLGVNRHVPLCKVDLMINESGDLQIAEIDAYNHRGIGYATFLRHIHEQYLNNRIAYDGVTSSLFPLLSESLSNFTFSFKERYYNEVFFLMQRILKKEGLDVNVLCTDNVLNFKKDAKYFIVPDSMQQSFELPVKEFLLDQYQKNESNFFYPLTPWIGNKGILGLLKNPLDSQVQILQSHFSPNARFDKYIPDSVLLFKGNSSNISVFKEKNKNFVFKKNIASGMKGVWLDANNSKISNQIDEASLHKTPLFSLQEKINQKKFDFKYFSENGEIFEKEFYVRLIVHVDPLTGNIVDAEMTARPEPDVHGAPDCLQIPCVF